MNLRGFSLAALLFVALGAGPACAQDTGTHIKQYDRAKDPHSTRMSKADTARHVMAGFAECLVDKEPKKTREFLAIFPGSAEYIKIVTRFSDVDCLDSGELSYDSVTFRGAIYKARYRKDYSKVAAPLRVEALSYADDGIGQNSAALQSYVVLREFADCVVRTDYQNSRALVLSAVASKAENEAFAAISPKLGPCMQDGVKVGFGKTQLFGLLAEALYRLSVPSAQTATPAGNQ